MRAVRVGEVTRGVHLVRADLVEQVDDQLHVPWSQQLLPRAPRLVEGHVEKAKTLRRHPAEAAGGPRFAAPDQCLDLPHLGAVDLSRPLLLEEALNVALERHGSLVIDPEATIELRCEVGEADRVFVEHGDFAGGLVRHVHLVALLHEPDQRAAHRDHVVVRVR